MLRALVLSLCAAGCTSPATVGMPCTDTADCAEGLSCFEHGDTTECMLDCDRDEVRLCDDGSVCTEATLGGMPRELGICYLGGDTAIGSACTGNLECVQGSICVEVDETQSCYAACTVGADPSDCGAGEECRELESMGDRGFCDAAP